VHLSWNEIKSLAIAFSKECKTKFFEDSEAKFFWVGFFKDLFTTLVCQITSKACSNNIQFGAVKFSSKRIPNKSFETLLIPVWRIDPTEERKSSARVNRNFERSYI